MKKYKYETFNEVLNAINYDEALVYIDLLWRCDYDNSVTLKDSWVDKNREEIKGLEKADLLEWRPSFMNGYQLYIVRKYGDWDSEL